MTTDKREPGIPEIDLTDPRLLQDPFATYGHARERSPLVRLVAPGMPPMWALTRHEDGRVMLSDPRFELNAQSFYLRPDVPADCRPYMRTMTEMDRSQHARLRRLVAPAFTPRRAAEFRPRVEQLVERLLDDLPKRVEAGAVDLLHFARPLPMDVICELVGIPERDRAQWREYGALVASGSGQGFAAAIPGIVEGAKAAVARRKVASADDLLGDLVRAQAEDGDRLNDTEMVTMVWQLVLSGETPSNVIANAMAALFAHPDQLALLRDSPSLMPDAVEELTRWCGPQLLTIPRYPREDVIFHDTVIPKGEPVVVAIAAANHDPCAFAEPDRLNVSRRAGPASHLGYAHGPHFCVGAPLARMQTEVALTALLRRFPGIALAIPAHEVRHDPDPGSWRVSSVPVYLAT